MLAAAGLVTDHSAGTRRFTNSFSEDGQRFGGRPNHPGADEMVNVPYTLVERCLA